ncbi:MAG: tetratricopeptide repeat protein [Deltaproteobacteria bacterium]|nr:tetratricopeptide repeat protein [Deltaproteobacteria bacterium]
MRKLYNSKSIAITIILIVSFGVYANTLFNGFVHDDNEQVLENPWIRDSRYIPDIMFGAVWAFKKLGATNYYRPTMNLTYMAEYHIFGLKPWGWHLVNIVFHALNSIMVFLIALIIFNKQAMLNLLQIQNLKSQFPIPAFIAAIFFVVHPVNTEPVAWVAGVPELTFTLFYLPSFYLYINYSVGSKSYIVAVILFFLGALSKETALTLPILLFIYDYVFRRDSIKTFSDYIKRYLPFAIIAGLYMLLRIYALNGFAPFKRHPELNSYQYFINIFPLFIQYLEKLLLPVNLNAFHVLHPVYSVLEPRFVISLLLTFSFFIFVILIKKTNNVVFFTLLWIFIPLLPALYIPGVGEATFAERYLYLPSAGFVILSTYMLAMLFDKLGCYNNGKFFRIVFVISLSVIIALCSAGTVKRSFVWANDLTLWSDTVKKSPDSIFVNYNLGRAYQEYGLFDNAISAYRDILRRDPSLIKVRNNLGVALGQMGLYAEAIAEFKKVLLTAPEDRDARRNIGLAYINIKDCDTARNFLKPEDDILIRQFLDKCSK